MAELGISDSSLQQVLEEALSQEILPKYDEYIITSGITMKEYGKEREKEALILIKMLAMSVVISRQA